MAIINGKEYTKHDLLQRVGNIGQIAGVRPVVLADGRAAGVHALDVKTGGGLEFSVLQDKGMDLFDFSFKGTNVCFQSKPGVVSAQLADLYGMGSGFKHSIAGGMMYTCGLQNNGGACVDQGSDHVFNGRIRNIPAEKLSIISKWDGDEYLLGVEGDIRETGLFSSNLVMHRSIHTKLGAKSLTLCDEVTNEGFSNAFPMIMYHINLGYPLLDENMHLILPDAQMEGLGELAQRDIASYNVMTPPTANAIEYAFVRHQATDSYGWSAAAAYNDRLEIGLYIRYNSSAMPKLIEWKCMMPGDYVLGLHVSNSLFGRTAMLEQGALKALAPMETRCFCVEFGILEGKEEAKAFEEELRAYK